MTPAARNYVAAVISAGALTIAVSLYGLEVPNLERLLLYLAFAAAAAPVKLRLPRMDGAFSLAFLPLLVGVAHFSLAETVLAACAGAAATTLMNRRTSPTLAQVLFNAADLVLTVGACFGMARYAVPDGAASLPIRLALAAAVYFFVSTVLVSGVLSLLNGKPLREINAQWYSWMFPYYLLGAVFVGILSTGGETAGVPTWLAALPLFHLIHFFYGLTQSKPSAEAGHDEEAALAPAARVYVAMVMIAGFLLAAAALWNWQQVEAARLAGFLVVTLVTSALKVRLPFLTGTLSFGFVPVLVAALEFSFPETAILAAATVAVQALWKPARRPTAQQMAFNVACLVTASAGVYSICRLPWFGPEFSIGKLAAATAVLYLANTMMVARVLSLIEHRPLFSIWRQCYFWTLPYYSVGSLLVALMIGTLKASSWHFSLLVLPLAGMIYVSYRMHLGAAARPVEPALPA